MKVCMYVCDDIKQRFNTAERVLKSPFVIGNIVGCEYAAFSGEVRAVILTTMIAREIAPIGKRHVSIMDFSERTLRTRKSIRSV